MTDTILIVGGGVAGLRSALRCVEAGARAIVVERKPVVGGRQAAALIGENVTDPLVPTLGQLRGVDAVEILTNAELVGVSGGPGNFTVTIEQRARFVTDTCTRCNHCRAVCPVAVPNEYDAGLTYRKAIFTPMPDTLPDAYAIDIDSCLNTPPNYLPCHRCIDVCDDDSIHFDLALQRHHERHVGAIIVATGCESGDPGELEALGYGTHPDVVTASELQRMLETPGPTGGFAIRPSNESYPERVLLMLEEPEEFATHILARQCAALVEQRVGHVSVLVLSQPPSTVQPGPLQQLPVQLRWGVAPGVDVDPDTGLSIRFEDLGSGHHVVEAYDLVVLWDDVRPARGTADLATRLGVRLGDDAFFATSEPDDVAAGREGVYIAGCARGARNMAASLDDGELAGMRAVADLDPRRLRPAGREGEPGPASGADGLPDDPLLRQRLESALKKIIDPGMGKPP